MPLCELRNRWVGVIVLSDGNVFKIDGQTNRMEVQASYAKRIAFHLPVQFPLGIGPQRFVDERQGQADDEQEGERNSKHPPPEPSASSGGTRRTRVFGVRRVVGL